MWPRRIHRSAKWLLRSSKRSISKFSRPKARTTRTPVRFSCTVEESLPSAMSASMNRLEILELKKNEYSAMMGIKTATTSEILTFIENMR